MKRTLLLAGMFSLVALLACPAADRPNPMLIVTNRGKVYEDCRVFQVDPDGVMIFHRHGGAKLLFAELPEETRLRLGYDARKAEAYEKDRAEAQLIKRWQMWEFRKEAARADAAANAANAARLNYEAAQQDAVTMMGYGGGYGFAPGLLATSYFPGFGHGWPAGYGNGHGYGYGHGHHRGNETTLTPATDILRFRSSRHGHAWPAARPVPFGVPAMGPLTPSMGPRTSNPGSVFPAR